MREQAARALGAPADRLWVTYLSESISTRQYPVVQAVIADLPNAFLIVKVHPAEAIDWYRQHVIPPMAGRVAVVQTHPELDLHGLLRASDLAVTYYSTTALESILCGTPVISVALDPEMCRRYPNIDWTEFGIPVSKTPVELAQAFSSLLDAEARARTLAEQRAGLRPLVKNCDGSSATEAVVNVVMECLEEFRHERSQALVQPVPGR
jgi:hypothetical protein